MDIKFSSIDNLYKSLNICDGGTIIATEKLHGCLQFKAQITLADGTTRSIKEIVDNKLECEVLGRDEKGNVVATKIVNWFQNGFTDQWLNVRFTRNSVGKGSYFGALKVTPNHKFFTKNGYVAASDLKIDDVVYVQRTALNPTYIQEQILIGKMLGDGSYDGAGGLSFGQSINQEAYLDFTLASLGNIAGNRQVNQMSGYGSVMVRGRTIRSLFLKKLFDKWLTRKGKQIPDDIVLSPISLAFWYMDDGNLSHQQDQEDRANFATCGFSEQSIDNLLKAFTKLGIVATRYIADGYYRIRLNSDEAEKLFVLIAPYIPESMQYKLPERYRGLNVSVLNTNGVYKPLLVEQKILSINSIVESRTKYDIETETHNYFANYVLVHNSNARVLVKKDGSIQVGSRNEVVDMFNPSGHFGFVKWVNERADNFRDLLHNADFYVFGEWVGPGIQRGVNYVKEKDFYAFGLTYFDGDTMIVMTYDEYKPIFESKGFNVVPELFRGKVLPSQATSIFDQIINQRSVVAKANGLDSVMEGVVIAGEKHHYDRFGHLMLAKHKSDAFKEVETGKAAGPRVINPNQQMIDSVSFVFANTFVTKERINHCLDHAREKGETVVNDMPDMKFLVKYVAADIEKECADALIFVCNLIDDRKPVDRAITKRISGLYLQMIKDAAVERMIQEDGVPA